MALRVYFERCYFRGYWERAASLTLMTTFDGRGLPVLVWPKQQVHMPRWSLAMELECSQTSSYM